MANKNERANYHFIRTLYKELRDPSNHSIPSKYNTGMVAKLKRAAGVPIEESMEAVSAVYYLMRVAKETASAKGEDIEFEERYFPVYFFVATNFAKSKREEINGNFGDTCRIVRSKLEAKGIGADSFDKKFMSLLNQSIDYKEDGLIDFVGLFRRLTAIISLSEANDVGVKWILLLSDLPKWSLPTKPIQRNWSRKYFGSTRDNVTDELDEEFLNSLEPNE